MIVCIIPAKGSSNRLENKNMQLLNGKPMIYYTLTAATKSKLIDKVYVSTESNEIAEFAKKTGIDVLKRPVYLTGETPVIDVYRHALKQIKNNEIAYVVGLQPDHPDRTINIDKAITFMRQKGFDDLFTVDSQGKKNGSLRIIKKDALLNNRIGLTGTLLDDCTNIHTKSDLLKAERRLLGGKVMIKIEDRFISKDSPAFIVAEGANNHNCDINIAKKMIDEAKDCGADAIKFQTFKAQHLVAKNTPIFWKMPGVKTQFEFYKRIDRFNKKDYQTLFNYSRKKGITCFSTPFDCQSATMLYDLGMQVFKVASCDLPDLRFIRHIAKFGKPIIISTGAAELEEIKTAVNTAFEAGNFQILLLSCMLSYPTRAIDANLLKIITLRENFPELIIGLSDHTEPDENMILPSLAVSLGAKVVEKHFTLDRNMPGPGHKFCVEPAEFKKMVKNIRLTETALGSAEIKIYEVEKTARQNARRSIVANRDIKKGEKITNDLIGIRRPGTGLSPAFIDLVIGKTANSDIKKDSQISLEQLINKVKLK